MIINIGVAGALLGVTMLIFSFWNKKVGFLYGGAAVTGIGLAIMIAGYLSN